MLLALAAAPLALSVMGATITPTPTPTPTPTETPTPTPHQGTLRVIKTDLSGAPVTVPGARFNVHRDKPDGQLVPPVLTTDATGTAMERLPEGMYCLEEIKAPPGFQQAPTYVPAQCQAVVAASPFPTIFSVADPPAPTPTPTDTPSPTPSPTPPDTGELQITKTDPGNKTITVPGFTFNIHVGSSGGQVIATISTDGTGMAVAGALNPAMYCVEEISAPDGYQVAPTYSPAACVNVASDSTQGRAPTVVTVIDPPASTPSPTADAGAAATPSPSATPHAAQAVVAQPPSSPAAALARGLVAVGALLLLVGAVMIVVAVRRRRRPPTEAPPSDYWYDSTIT
jgi:uncharacterized surface anchored protein